jgi:hypothetical protein
MGKTFGIVVLAVIAGGVAWLWRAHYLTAQITLSPGKPMSGIGPGNPPQPDVQGPVTIGSGTRQQWNPIIYSSREKPRDVRLGYDANGNPITRI